ncbi:MAG TPA: NnrS family protein [Parvibaculum sp.]|uniref:NnrS family protein n=1 Tax=Parvibaculum sp. TaxID=2024848 RepID=UPI002BD93AD4|nr:NnrS family protein [Parvibaculum sp.]HMM14369.1 NnrS family protein [Parvibaculum sp.]
MEGTSSQRRAYVGSAFLSGGFRPFYLCGALYAALAVPFWVLFLHGIVAPGGAPLEPLYWHAHEMIFGFLGAIVGGFILTAIPNWTGRLPVMGNPLGALLALWLAGRVGVALLGAGAITPAAALLLDLAYPAALVATTLREIVAGKNWRNLPVVGLVAVFGLANLLFYISFWTALDPMLAIRLALGGAAVLITLIGGRITPSFTRNWLAKGHGEPFPAPFGMVDRAALLLTGLSMLGWAIFVDGPAVGALLLLAGAVQLVRLLRWQGLRTASEPLVLILHIGYGWLVVSLLAMGAAALAPYAVNGSAALHALTAGAIGTMTLAVMTRSTLGHTGRALTADGGTVAIFVLVNLGAVLRIAAHLLPMNYVQATTIAGTFWSAAFLVFALKYGQYLLTPRR